MLCCAVLHCAALFWGLCYAVLHCAALRCAAVWGGLLLGCRKAAEVRAERAEGLLVSAHNTDTQHRYLVSVIGAQWISPCS